MDCSTTDFVPGLARTAAQVALAIGREVIEQPIREKVSLLLLDFLGCCMEASRSEAGRKMLAYGRTAVSRPESQVERSATHHDSGAEIEALLYGMLGHALIREDMHVPSGTHPGAVILPAMLALARREKLSGEALVRGIAAGYHVMGALGTAARAGLTNRHFRPLGISGPFGATAGALAATGADEETAVNALAFAANFASGLNQWPWSGGQEIYVQAGMAARNALVALDLGRTGLRASPDILEGKDGLFKAIGSGPEAASIFLKNLSASNSVMDVTHKPVSGCNYVQTAGAAALYLSKRLGPGGTSNIRNVVISTFSAARAYPGCDNTGPFDYLEQRKMSFQFAICTALRYGRLDGESYSAPPDSELVRLIGATEIRIDDKFERRKFPAQPARLELVMSDGNRLSHELPDVPWLNPDQVQLRFEAEAAPSLSSPDVERLCVLVSTLWDQADTSELFVLLRRAGVTPDC